MKTLFGEDFEYNTDGMKLAEDFDSLKVMNLISQYVSRGFSPREIQYILTMHISDLCLDTILDLRSSEAKPQFKLNIINKCHSCDYEGTEQKHSCPFKSEINGNDEDVCNCCDNCQRRCAMEI